MVALGFADKAMLFDGFHVGHHQCEGFVHAQFAVAEFGYGLRVSCITRQVKSTQTFDGENFSFGENAAGFGEGGFS